MEDADFDFDDPSQVTKVWRALTDQEVAQVRHETVQMAHCTSCHEECFRAETEPYSGLCQRCWEMGPGVIRELARPSWDNWIFIAATVAATVWSVWMASS